MGKTLGIVALVFGIIGVVVLLIDIYLTFIFVALSPFIYPPIPLLTTLAVIIIACIIVAIVCGAVGIKKDDSPGLAIAGLVLGSILTIPFLIGIIGALISSLTTPYPIPP